MMNHPGSRVDHTLYKRIAMRQMLIHRTFPMSISPTPERRVEPSRRVSECDNAPT
jgi:hypothetical protein